MLAHSDAPRAIRPVPMYEALDAKGYAYLRPARVVGELPGPPERFAALEDAGPELAKMLKLAQLRPVLFGAPVGLAFMTRAQMRKHPLRAFLQRLGDDLPLAFCPSYAEPVPSHARGSGASTYRLAMVRRTLSRADAKSFGHRDRYETAARWVADAVIGAGI